MTTFLCYTFSSVANARTLILLAIVISMSTLRLPQNLACSPGDHRSQTDHQQAQCQCGTEPAEPFHRTAVHDALGGSDSLVARRQERSRSSPTSAAATISGWCPPTGGWPTQLTVSDQRQTSADWSPDGKWIAYISDYDGDEQWDIFFVSPKTGQVVNITNTREISEESPTWSPRRALSRLHGEAEDVVGVRDRHLRHPDARHQTPDHRHAQGQDERQSHLVRRQTSGSPTPSSRPRAQIPISSSPKSPPARARC